MTLYEELKARGLVAQITDEEIIDLINNGKATFYIGFDCTADSLTAGHFMALTLMKRLQMAGNKPIALIGGGTTMIGDDQWSNMLGGTELIRRKLGKDAYAMTITLLTDSQGKKMGKTAGNAVWLDPNKTSPFEFYQYWRNVGDADVMKCIRMLTFLPLEQIDEMSTWKDQRLNEAKEILAYELTSMVHGKEEAEKGPECCPRTVQRQRNGYRAHAFYSADRGRPDRWLHRHPDPDGQGWSGSIQRRGTPSGRAGRCSGGWREGSRSHRWLHC